ncbi:unnamed protein product, partial [Amoebophrya sp. A120]
IPGSSSSLASANKNAPRRRTSSDGNAPADTSSSKDETRKTLETFFDEFPQIRSPEHPLFSIVDSVFEYYEEETVSANRVQEWENSLINYCNKILAA